MDDNQPQLTEKSAKEDDEHTIVIQLSKEDRLFEEKKKLLEGRGFDHKGCVRLKSSYSLESLNSILEELLRRARIINADEVDLYFEDMDAFHPAGFCSPKNELESLHSILSIVDKSISNCQGMGVKVLQDLRHATLNKIHDFGNDIREETRILANCSCDKEKRLLQWGETNGIRAKVEIAFVEGAGRGAIAIDDLKVGDIVLDIPVSAIISEELLHESDMFPVLEKIEGISSETILLLWSMREKYNRDSKFKIYFDALPQAFNTGLSFGIDAVMALDGTLLLDELVQAKEHLRSQYDCLIPLLCDDHPDMFPRELYTWEEFLWACELWYSNSMKVMFGDGKLRTCLIPIAGFFNHSVSPHITHYGRLDSTTNSLKFPLSRPCSAGEQCFLSYGNFSTSHLLTFYGFIPQGENPYDVIPLDIDLPQVDSLDNGSLLSTWTTHMVRGTWLSRNNGIFHYGLPPPLLEHLRLARNPTLKSNILAKESLEIELEVLEDLRSTFGAMMETLIETETEISMEDLDWDVKLALEFKDLHRRIVSSILTSCQAGSKLVEQELSKFIS